MTGGLLGEIFASLAFSGALVAAISFFKASRSGEKSWNFIGTLSFLLHALGVTGIIVTLFGLIYTHQYQYHYVWSHSSNELPVHFMISCFWEGQEGSFLLWSFWHVVLGLIILRRRSEWRPIVLAVISSVNLILASMVLGIHISEDAVKILLCFSILAPAGFLMYRFLMRSTEIQPVRIFHLTGATLALAGAALVLLDKAGFLAGETWFVDLFREKHLLLYLPFWLLWIGFACLLIAYIILSGQNARTKGINVYELLAAFAILVLSGILMSTGTGDWKIGSTPFILLRDALPSAPVFINNPEFVPLNGNGLNPLLQNYWMVIHPPTLFLGFASTVVPFAFVIGALVKRNFEGWVRPAAPWLVFSVMILGTGIIMGGYWAYETLNFGGYWNWDPVENSSLVPWLLGIAALHGTLAFRKSGTFLKYSMILVCVTFLLVLYSTFLTRSGILGETSVHTFTDLGLSGQLLLLLFVYITAVIVLFFSRWHEILEKVRAIPFRSSEFFLFLATLVFLFSGLIIIFSTSLPVFNYLLGTHFAGAKDPPLYYYEFVVWFAILFGVLSGIGQFLFWRNVLQRPVREAIARPFFAAMVTAALLVIYIRLQEWSFAFQSDYSEWLEMAGLTESAFRRIGYYFLYGLYYFADEIMLASALFGVTANLDILIRLLVRNRKVLRSLGGSLAHVGFGLMIAGFLFSSGYDTVISKNSAPDVLARFSEAERKDNVLLLKNQPDFIPGYQVTYTGKKEARPPVSDVRVLHSDRESFKASFRDSTGDVYSFVFPKDVFVSGENKEIDTAAVRNFLNEKVDILKPKHINERSLYGVEFVPIRRNAETGGVEQLTHKAFTLYPEAEVNDNMGLIAHPSRKIRFSEDIYVHVSSVPSDEEEHQPEFQPYKFNLHVGDTVQTKHAMIILRSITPQPAEGTPFDLIASADLEVITENGMIQKVAPLYKIDSLNRVFVEDAWVEDIHTDFIFNSVNTEERSIELVAQEEKNPQQDFIVLKAIRKPWINVLWLGTFVLIFGFMMAILRRWREARSGSNPEQE